MRCGWTWRARWHAWPEPLTFEEAGEGAIACQPERFGDVVLARKDAPASYHLCVTHDDARAGRHAGDARRGPEAGNRICTGCCRR